MTRENQYKLGKKKKKQTHTKKMGLNITYALSMKAGLHLVFLSQAVMNANCYHWGTKGR